MLNTTTEEEATGTAAGEDGMVDLGTVETEPTLGLGLGLGLLGGALATAPYYPAPYLRSTRLRPCSNRPHHLVLVRSISAILPICSHVPGSMATGGPVNDLKSIPSKSE